MFVVYNIKTGTGAGSSRKPRADGPNLFGRCSRKNSLNESRVILLAACAQRPALAAKQAMSARARSASVFSRSHAWDWPALRPNLGDARCGQRMTKPAAFVTAKRRSCPAGAHERRWGRVLQQGRFPLHVPAEDDSPAATREQRQAGFVEAEENFMRLQCLQQCNWQVFRSHFALRLPACERAHPRTR